MLKKEMFDLYDFIKRSVSRVECVRDLDGAIKCMYLYVSMYDVESFLVLLDESFSDLLKDGGLEVNIIEEAFVRVELKEEIIDHVCDIFQTESWLELITERCCENSGVYKKI